MHLIELFGHLSDGLTWVRGGLGQQSEFLVTHHSLMDGFTLNWGSMRSVWKRGQSPQQRLSCTCLLRPHRGQSSCDFSHRHESLSYFNSFRSSVCVDSVCGTVGRWRRFSICVRFLVMSFCSQAKKNKNKKKSKNPRLGCLQQLFYLTCMSCVDVLWFTSWQVWAAIFASVIAPHTLTCHQFTFHRFGSLKLIQQPWQPAGLTLWEAEANLPLLVYLLNATLHELRQQERGRCCFMWVAETFGL